MSSSSAMLERSARLVERASFPDESLSIYEMKYRRFTRHQAHVVDRPSAVEIASVALASNHIPTEHDFGDEDMLEDL